MEKDLRATEKNQIKPLKPKDAAKLAKMESSMYSLYQSAKIEKREFNTPEELERYIDNYIELCHANGLFPTENGLAFYLGISPTKYRAYLMADSWQGEILELYRLFVSETINQAGLTGTSDRVFSIYFLKSKMQEWDQPTEMTININSTKKLKTDDMLDVMNSTPVIETTFKEVK